MKYNDLYKTINGLFLKNEAVASYLNSDPLLFHTQNLSGLDFLRAVVATLWLGLCQLKI